jgi:DNA-binding transcriptional LysR family regulator
MDIRHIRTFVTVAELGTVSKAASHLHVAQPALSRQIALLESEFGVQLFDRVGRRLLLTSDGEQMLSECRGLLDHTRALTERARILQGGRAGVLRVCASPHLIEGVFPGLLNLYAARFPEVDVRLIDAVGTESFEMLERGEVNLVQTTAMWLADTEDRFASHPIAPMEMLAAFPPSLKLGGRGEVEINQLEPHRLLHATRDFQMRRVFDAACRMAGFTPNYVLESRSPHALLAMAEAGHGVAIIPSTLRVHQFKVRRARVVHRGRPVDVPLAMAWDKRRPLPQYAEVFCDMVSIYVQQEFPVQGRKKTPEN